MFSLTTYKCVAVLGCQNIQDAYSVTVFVTFVDHSQQRTVSSGPQPLQLPALPPAHCSSCAVRNQKLYYELIPNKMHIVT